MVPRILLLTLLQIYGRYLNNVFEFIDVANIQTAMSLAAQATRAGRVIP